ncbi:hypothetical protein B0T20DRAFT_465531 [Sordaria brevicollis]|uniref:Uncharacterized protein n=1 Tax=Sordaria brevicollis TaxID=83679 RepID=A0AAE0PM79_SORBR|nr:hypothetical protein B0T20DRAFT_465531 [Sordaria brevicollis]
MMNCGQAFQYSYSSSSTSASSSLALHFHLQIIISRSHLPLLLLLLYHVGLSDSSLCRFSVFIFHFDINIFDIFFFFFKVFPIFNSSTLRDCRRDIKIHLVFLMVFDLHHLAIAPGILDTILDFKHRRDSHRRDTHTFGFPRRACGLQSVFAVFDSASSSSFVTPLVATPQWARSIFTVARSSVFDIVVFIIWSSSSTPLCGLRHSGIDAFCFFWSSSSSAAGLRPSTFPVILGLLHVLHHLRRTQQRSSTIFNSDLGLRLLLQGRQVPFLFAAIESMPTKLPSIKFPFRKKYRCAWTEASARYGQNVSRAFELLAGEVENSLQIRSKTSVRQAIPTFLLSLPLANDDQTPQELPALCSPTCSYHELNHLYPYVKRDLSRRDEAKTSKRTEASTFFQHLLDLFMSRVFNRIPLLHLFFPILLCLECVVQGCRNEEAGGVAVLGFEPCNETWASR